MARSPFGVLIFGVLGVGILISLGIWQLHRLEIKTAYLAEIEAKISTQAGALPENPVPSQDRFRAVSFDGVLLPDEIHILTSRVGQGVAYRVIGVVVSDGRRILVDRGLIPQAEKEAKRPTGFIRVVGNLHWPDEVDIFTPAPDLAENIWFARDLDALARALASEPFLVIMRQSTHTPPEPRPLTASGIPNNHLEYALTWFALAVVWAGMTWYLLWGMKHGKA